MNSRPAIALFALVALPLSAAAITAFHELASSPPPIQPHFVDQWSGETIPDGWVRFRLGDRVQPSGAGIWASWLNDPEASWLITIPSPEGPVEWGVRVGDTLTDRADVFALPRSPHILFRVVAPDGSALVPDAEIAVAFVNETAWKAAISSVGVDRDRSWEETIQALLDAYKREYFGASRLASRLSSEDDFEAAMEWLMPVERDTELGVHVLIPERVGLMLYVVRRNGALYAWGLGRGSPGSDFEVMVKP